MLDYAAYLEAKALLDPATGIDEVGDLHDAMKAFQGDIARWALRRGRAALFAGTGLGKSFMEMVWADQVARFTGKPVLMLTPLAVAQQFIEEEGPKFGFALNRVSEQGQIRPGVNVTNYDKMDRFDFRSLGGLVLDESSILKAYDGKTRTALIAAAQPIPFRLAASATPAPNDFMELGNHAEFLGVMSYAEMLAMFFVHDGGDTQKWRLKGHAESEFWRWMCSWAVMLTKPSDLGYADEGYDLPPLHQHHHIVPVDHVPGMGGSLFPIEARTMQERLAARRDTITQRVATAADLINGNDRQWVAWCNLNDESAALASAIEGAAELRGSDSEAAKERAIARFRSGETRVLVSKPSILGWGLNFQFCRDTAFVGLNDSFEQVFQAVRRFWRFGQTEAVNAHFIAAETEGAVVQNLKRKEADAERMTRAMVAHMADLCAVNIRGAEREKAGYAPRGLSLPRFLEAA